jgi:hypothetical protein
MDEIYREVTPESNSIEWRRRKKRKQVECGIK